MIRYLVAGDVNGGILSGWHNTVEGAEEARQKISATAPNLKLWKYEDGELTEIKPPKPEYLLIWDDGEKQAMVGESFEHHTDLYAPADGDEIFVREGNTYRKLSQEEIEALS